MAKETPVTIHRNERVLAFMIAGIVGLSIVALFALMIAPASGLPANQFQGGFWQAVALLPGVGLPIGFLLIIALLVISARRRGRDAAASVPRNSSSTKK
ncbi:hypothetical protein [Glaciihabitans sp. GrIS 2.15]|uniref:hypothetical protein n=1 Tax=Glaciihabitans sp. GrIS 2.15 TaxID=3071710 RepID=UPI002E0D14A9